MNKRIRYRSRVHVQAPGWREAAGTVLAALTIAVVLWLATGGWVYVYRLLP